MDWPPREERAWDPLLPAFVLGRFVKIIKDDDLHSPILRATPLVRLFRCTNSHIGD